MTDSYGDTGTAQDEPRKKPKRWPWLAGIVIAFAIGGGGGLVVAGGVEPEIVTEEVEVEVEPADLLERREALDERETVLDDRGETLSTRSSDLDEREETLDATEAELGEREEAIAEDELRLEENTIPGSGTFLVGEDIEPGTYRSLEAEYCHWDRLSGLGGDYDEDVITSGFSEGNSYVTITESDTAFSSEGCADWILQEP